MNKFIVITSIFEPSEAVAKFAALDEYQLIVVGDKKIPSDWHCNNVLFLSVEQQMESHFKLSQQLPFNHYCRKMLGYLQAMAQGATVIIDTDDDNIPEGYWAFPDFSAEYRCSINELSFVNVYNLYTEQKIWPRGLPLRFVNRPDRLTNDQFETESVEVGIWQGLANEDPDVDAVYRLTSDAWCDFERNGEYVLGQGTISPFNSQNTAVRAELFPLLYLPSTVTFRFTDILRGYVAQPIMWLYGYRLGFTEATVLQKRNPHDYMKDFESEIPMYLHSEKVIDLVSEVIDSRLSVGQNLYLAYEALQRAGIVQVDELVTLQAWLADYEELMD